MAPCNTQIQIGEENSCKQTRKLRKPVIEKMRRDRINSSIEQLRILLEKEFQKQQLPSKPEKADILEMTVSFLQQHLAAKYMSTANQTHKEGFSKCLKESENFLAAHEDTKNHQWNLLRHFHTQHITSNEVIHTAVTNPQIITGLPTRDTSKSLWRPW
ncbi:transcription factor HES-5-like [Bombina bombina]|uniref:transcription factor HES-5-like n=1 Tax=Bombina bombina TaxID=8345 RepID=UPI00235A68C3|nr:transcription factor HES-5-like [Bombina bombina]